MIKSLKLLLYIPFVSLLLFSFLPNQSQIFAQEQSEAKIIYFHATGCSHCARVEAWFESEDIYNRYPIDDREIRNNPENGDYFNQVMSGLNVPLSSRATPTLVLGENYLVGDTPIIEGFYEAADSYLADNGSAVAPVLAEDNSADELSLWVVISASLVDAINPCAFAVLIILLSTVLVKKDNRRSALYSGLAFTMAIFISYILMGWGLYQAINATNITNSITTVVGILAIILGLFNLKDFFAYGKLFKVEVPERWRPNMKKIIKTVTTPQTAFLVGIVVSLFLLPCTSGPYIVVIGLLANNPFDALALFYLLLYNLIFISPMLIITYLAFKGSDIEKLEYYRQANLERLHLIAGLILIGIGLFVLL